MTTDNDSAICDNLLLLQELRIFGAQINTFTPGPAGRVPHLGAFPRCACRGRKTHLRNTKVWHPRVRQGKSMVAKFLPTSENGVL
jgi:hypothetical protein